MSIAVLVGAAVAYGGLRPATNSQVIGPALACRQMPRGVSSNVEGLIGELQRCELRDEEGAGLSGFPPVYPSRGLAPGSHADPITALVSMGARAFPALLMHLDDARPTRAVINSGSYQPDTQGSPGIRRRYFFSYLPRRPAFAWSDEDGQRIEFAAPRIEGASYTAKVGDFCYDIIGDIANRDNAWADRWGIAASPVLSADLASRVREDWSGVTSSGLQRSLMHDLWNSRSQSTRIGALERLLYYYPAFARQQVGKLVTRPFISWEVADGCAFALMDTRADSEAKSILDSFRRNHSQTENRYLADCIVSVAFTQSDSNLPKWQERAVELLRRFFPKYKPAHPLACHVNSVDQAQDLVRVFWEFDYPWLRRSNLLLFHKCVAFRGEQDRDSVDKLAVACLGALHGRQAKAVARYLRNRIAQLTRPGSDDTEQSWAAFLNRGLALKVAWGDPLLR